MPVQHIPSAKNTRSNRNTAYMTPTTRVSFDCTPTLHQLSANLDRRPPMEEEEPSKTAGLKSRISRLSLDFQWLSWYHERQKEKGSHQKKNPPVTGSNCSTPPQGSSLKRNKQKSNKGKKFDVSNGKPHAALLNRHNKLFGCEKEGRIKQGLCNYCRGKHPIGKFLKRPQNNPGSSRGFPSK
ncbi:hypothetical protein O181_038475 [Austropuccinia psidii MF-1]|uniref:Uncharacterized protein n=1 Tax=Austropuccinia psidii MF-1 TaxID=1389203 RepID=A0A9Q3HE65_9BASI|nr:hypothetical protein [Austropuccinia psidii MF-1]